MSTTRDFVQNLNADNIALVITRYFDEIMVLYDLVGKRQDIDICADSSGVNVTFTLLMDSKEAAKALYDDLNSTEFSVYQDVFLIEMQLTGESIITTIRRDR